MANQDHLDILKQGIDVWNQWKQKHLDIAPDFIGSSLFDANFHQANFQGASFNNANLGRTSFNNANLTNALQPHLLREILP